MLINQIMVSKWDLAIRELITLRPHFPSGQSTETNSTICVCCKWIRGKQHIKHILRAGPLECYWYLGRGAAICDPLLSEFHGKSSSYQWPPTPSLLRVLVISCWMAFIHWLYNNSDNTRAVIGQYLLIFIRINHGKCSYYIKAIYHIQ